MGMYESFEPLSQSGCDLSQYPNQLQRERSSRTLNLRRINKPSISSITGKVINANAKPKMADLASFPYVDPQYIITTLSKGNYREMNELFQNLINCAKSTPRMLNAIATNESVLETLANCLTDTYPDPTIILLIMTISALFPLCGRAADSFVDNFCFSFESLLSSNNQQIVGCTIGLIATVADNSSYGRNSILCLEIHKLLVKIVLSETTPELTNAAADAIFRIYANPEPIEPEILLDSVEDMVQALHVSSLSAVNSIISSFVEMTNDFPSLVNNLFDLGLFPIVVQLLDNPLCVSASLRLIGNLSVAQPSQINVMLESGLLPKLISFIESEHCSDVFWVLSNLIESVPPLLLPLVNLDFINRVLDISEISSFEIKRESAFFIATVIVFTHHANLQYLMNEKIIDLLVEMLGCEVEYIVVRCVDAILKFLAYAMNNTSNCESCLACLNNSDLNDRIEELLADQEKGDLTDRVEFLRHQVQILNASAT
ncbi:hypothetical protein GPJ56_003976 [Histomonas meleagridis]|uniref:uncharacterized protein n=1 Tax=Histomonas meleagridis TaxID=135588 RepID=UPI00355A741C|nr:hypothetical protein GPJ56_003976 [Histomonas meleagridis]KAH0798089.1 hypothetical protein GO595_009100 [Histomonas meleagridis]